MQEVAAGDLALNYDRKVPPDPRKAGQRASLWRPPTCGAKAVEEDLGDHRPPGEPELGHHLRVHLPDDADRLSPIQDFPRPTGVEPGEAPRVETRKFCLFEIGHWEGEAVAHGSERRLQGADFRGRRVGSPRRDVGRQRQHLRLLDGVRIRLPENGAQLEEVRPALVLPCVEGERLQKSGEQAATKRVAVFRHRVLDCHRRRRRHGHRDRERATATDQAAGQRLIELVAGQDLAGSLVDLGAHVQIAHWRASSGQRAGHPVVAIDPANLFDQVLGNRAVQPEDRRPRAQPAILPLHRETETPQDAGRLTELDRDPQDPIDPIGVHLDCDRLERTGIHVG